jgi:hypothetical protein
MEFKLTDENGTELVVRVHPETVPTTAAEYHHTATHRDALGMPVAFSEPFPGEGKFPYHPTPCCGAAASISDPEYGMYCKACYEQVDPAFGNVPVEPFEALS